MPWSRNTSHSAMTKNAGLRDGDIFPAMGDISGLLVGWMSGDWMYNDAVHSSISRVKK